jgi:NADPH:quinone reductase-like Zn-dependent oxidoreductase
MGGRLAKDVDLNKFLQKRIKLQFTTLRNRSDEFKTELINNFSKDILSNFTENGFMPVIDSIYTNETIKDAHVKMESNLNIGKLVVKWI